MAPILAHFDAQKPVIIETDASDFAIGAVLWQRDSKGRLHPVAFHSRKFQPAEINYEIHDKELLAIVDTFKQWRRNCKGAVHQVQVFSNLQNLEYFTTTKILNKQQVRWAQELVGINFQIYYGPEIQNGKPDVLSRRSEYCPEKGVWKTSQSRRLWEKITSQKQTVEDEHLFAPRHDSPLSQQRNGTRNSRKE